MGHFAATPTNKTQPNSLGHPTQVRGMGSWTALTEPLQGQALPWSSRSCSMVLPQHLGWRQDHGLFTEHMGKVGDEGQPVDVCDFLRKQPRSRDTLQNLSKRYWHWLSLLPMVHGSTEIRRKLLHRILWQCGELSNKMYLSYIYPLNLGLLIFLHIVKKIPCRLILE